MHVLTEDVPAAPAAVRAFYTDLDNLAAVHPLVVSVRRTQRTVLADGHRQSYRVTDRIPWGPITLRTTYRAQVTTPRVGDVIAEARQFPRVRLTTVVSFSPTESGTRITERLTIAAPRPLAALTERKAVAAHREMLAGIRRRFEVGSV